MLRLLALLSFFGFSAVLPASDLYSADVEFLLRELPARADSLLKLKAVPWETVELQFREEVRSVSSDAQHVKLCGRLLARLRDGHAGLTGLRVSLSDESAGRRWTGPHVHLLVTGERVLVRQAFGVAAQQGLSIGQEVLRVDGEPAGSWLRRRVESLRDEHGYSTDGQALYAACHWGLAGWEGQEIALDVRVGSGTNTFRLRRRGGSNYVPIGPVFLPDECRSLGRQSYGKTAAGFGYIHLRDVPGDLPGQLDLMLDSLGEVSGLILDLRANGGGGCDHAAVFGRFLPPGGTWRQYRSAGRRPYAGPLVVIVDAGTRSAGETVAGLLKEDGRAFLIGDTATAGSSSQKETLTVPSGLFQVRFSVRSNLQRLNGGRGIEGLGVAPHETVPYEPDELLRKVDSQIRRAEAWLQSGLPPERVAFETSRR